VAGDGSALIIHTEADDQISDPAGNSGDCIACGVITPASGQAAEATPQPPTSAPEVGVAVPAQQRPTDDLIASLQLPEGFSVGVFAEGLSRPRMMAQAEDGTVYVTLEDEGDVIALRDPDGDGQAGEPENVVRELEGVHGVTIHEGRIYLATPKTVYVSELGGDGLELEPLVKGLPDGDQHHSRTLAFGPDGLLYVNVGSSCNACVETDEENAAILQVQPDGASRTIYASGLRNSLGFAWHPETGELWGMDMGTDWRGHDQPPEELNRLVQDGNYGWPYCYGAREPDTNIPYEPEGALPEEYCNLTEAPILTYQAHSAPINLSFYTGDMFPAEYQNSAFVTMRGSWNRQPATGYKVVRLLFDEGGQPAGFEDFLTGFLSEDGQSNFGRIAGLLVLQDGSLLVSEDTGGVIYRVTYEGDQASR
jgi:glucose/arabinose dehydrogenase